MRLNNANEEVECMMAKFARAITPKIEKHGETHFPPFSDQFYH